MIIAALQRSGQTWLQRVKILGGRARRGMRPRCAARPRAAALALVGRAGLAAGAATAAATQRRSGGGSSATRRRPRRSATATRGRGAAAGGVGARRCGAHARPRRGWRVCRKSVRFPPKIVQIRFVGLRAAPRWGFAFLDFCQVPDLSLPPSPRRHGARLGGTECLAL